MTAPTPAGLPLASPDLEFGAFSEQGPWVLDLDAIPWRWDVDRIRRGTRVEVANLLAPGRIPPLGRLVKVVGAIGGALAAWFVLEWRRPRSRAGISRRMRRAFEQLGSSYVKLGQIISGGEGLFPDELVAEFKLLRDQVPPEPFTDVRAVVEVELGGRLDELFSHFDEVPIAAASIAQVHAATLITGEEVVVKIQRPRVAELFRADIAALVWLAPHLVGRIPVTALANPPALVDLFAETVIEELDFRLEAENMLDIAAVFAATNQRAIIVPRPHPTLVTRRVLVMERLHGFAFDDVESMQAAGIDTHALLQAGLIASLEGALIYGVFHGDLHGGNLVVQPDGRTVLFDFGQTGRLTEPQRLAFLRLLMNGSTGDARGQLAALRDLGAFPPDVDIEAVVADLGLDGPVKDPVQMSADELMVEMREITKKLLGYGARAPKELMLFVKNMMFLNSATAILAPDLDMIEQMMQIYMYFAQQHGDRIMREVGIDAAQAAPDRDAVKAAFMVESDVEKLTFRDIQARRDEVRAKFAGVAAAAVRGRVRKRFVVPELPQMQALAERLAAVLTGRVLERADPLGFSALKTVVPAPDSFVGATVESVGRTGKYLVLDFGVVGRILVHLSQAGRVDVEDPPKRTRAKGSVVRFVFASPSDVEAAPVGILVREYGHERKAAWWVLAPGDDGPLERLGPEPASDEFADFILHGDDRRRVHTILRDQRTVSGVGRGYADDALWRAQLSPYATLASLDDDARTRLLTAIREVMAQGVERERTRSGGLSTPKLGDHFEVHARYGTPCPRCGEILRRVSYASHEIAYCPACQTGGKVLADRRMSRLVK